MDTNCKNGWELELPSVVLSIQWSTLGICYLEPDLVQNFSVFLSPFPFTAFLAPSFVVFALPAPVLSKESLNTAKFSSKFSRIFPEKNRNLFCISKLQMCILRCVSIFSCFLSGVLFLSQLFAFTYSLLTCLIVIVIVTSLLCWIVFIVHNFRQKNTLCREYRQNMRNAHKRRARSSEFSIFWFFFWIRLFKEWIIILFF